MVTKEGAGMGHCSAAARAAMSRQMPSLLGIAPEKFWPAEGPQGPQSPS